jgi:hypothetical protein
MSNFYKNPKGGNVSMELLNSIIRVSIRKEMVSYHDDKVFHIAALAAAEKTKRGHASSVWKHIFDIAAEDFGGAMYSSHVKRILYIYGNWSRSKNIKNTENINILIAINYLCIISKSRMAFTSAVCALSRISLDEYPSFPKGFDDSQFAPLNFEWKEEKREWNAACRMAVAISDKNYSKALHYLTLLWEWNCDSTGVASIPTDTVRNTRQLLWEIMERISSEIAVFREAYKTFYKITNNYSKLWTIIALMRVCKYEAEIGSLEEKKEPELYNRAEEMSTQQMDMLFNGNLEIPVLDMYYDKNTKQGRKLGRGYKHFFEKSGMVENELFPDPFYLSAKKIYLSEEEKHGTKCGSKDMRLRLRLKFESKNTIVKKEKRTADSEHISQKTRIRKIDTIMKEGAVMLNPILSQQLSSNKCPSYYAIYMDASIVKSVFVKGPFKNQELLTAQYISDQFKYELDTPWLHSVNMQKVQMIPSIFTKCDYVGHFLVCDDLWDYRFCKTKTVGKQTILDRNTSQCTNVSVELLEKCDDFIMVQFLCILIYRFSMEMNDTCEENIVFSRLENRMYSIEETIFNGKKSTIFKRKIYPHMKNVIMKRLEKRWDVLTSICKEWCEMKHINSITKEQYQLFCSNVKKCIYDRSSFESLL